MSFKDKPLSTGERAVSGDLDSLKGLQLTSNGQHKICVIEQSWVPWLVYSDQWNAASAFNLAQLADLSYLEQSADENGMPYDSDDESIYGFFGFGLTTKATRTPPESDLPLLTRSVRRGDRFQDLRFWDAANIRQKGDPDVDPQALAVRNRDQILIAVRGTEPKNLVDWLSDFRFATRAFEEGPPPEETANGRPFQVHTGFHQNFRMLKPHIDAYLSEHLELDAPIDGRSQRDVILCGHSLGGATALLLAAYIRSHYARRVMLYTYGMPRVGEQPFAEHYDPETGTEPIYHFRHVHHQDIVTRLPPRWADRNGEQSGMDQLVSSGKAVTRIAKTIDGDAVPYAHHGTLVYLPPAQNPASVPTLSYQLTDLVNFNELFKVEAGVFEGGAAQDVAVSGLFSSLKNEMGIWNQWVRGLAGEEYILTNEDDDVRVQSMRELQSTYWLSSYANVQGALQHATNAAWEQVASEIQQAVAKKGAALFHLSSAAEMTHRVMDHFMTKYTEVVRRGLVQQIEFVLNEEGTLAEQVYENQQERQRLEEQINAMHRQLENDLALRRLQRRDDLEPTVVRGSLARDHLMPPPSGTAVVLIDIDSVEHDLVVMVDAGALIGRAGNEEETSGDDGIHWLRFPATQLQDAQREEGADTARILILLDENGRSGGSTNGVERTDGDFSFYAKQPGVVCQQLRLPGVRDAMDAGTPVTAATVRVETYAYDAQKEFVLDEQGALASTYVEREATIAAQSDTIAALRSRLERHRETGNRHTVPTIEVAAGRGDYDDRHGSLRFGDGTVVVDVVMPRLPAGQSETRDVFVRVDASPLLPDEHASADVNWVRVTAEQLRAAHREVHDSDDADRVRVTVVLDASPCAGGTTPGQSCTCYDVFAGQPGVIMKHAGVPGLDEALAPGRRLSPGDVHAAAYFHSADRRAEHLAEVNNLRETLTEAVNRRTALYPYEDLFHHLPPLRRPNEADDAETLQHVFRTFLAHAGGAAVNGEDQK